MFQAQSQALTHDNVFNPHGNFMVPSHSTDEDTEAQKGQVAFPGS